MPSWLGKQTGVACVASTTRLKSCQVCKIPGNVGVVTREGRVWEWKGAQWGIWTASQSCHFQENVRPHLEAGKQGCKFIAPFKKWESSGEVKLKTEFFSKWNICKVQKGRARHAGVYSRSICSYIKQEVLYKNVACLWRELLNFP